MGEPFLPFSPPSISSLPPPSPDGRASWMQAGLEVSLFLSMAAILVLHTYLPLARPVSRPPRVLGGISPAFLLVPVPLFLVGLARGLPRWAYPFGGMLLGYAFLAAIRFSMVPLFAASLLATVLLAVAAAVVNSRVRPLPPLLRRVGQSIGSDWTRVSFCIYGAMPLVILTAFDDARVDSRTPYLAASVLLMVVGAFAYVRSRRTVRQLIALLGGMSLSVWCAYLDRAAFVRGWGTWLSSPGLWIAEIGWTLRLWASMTAFILAPFLIGLALRALAPRHAA